VRSSLASKRRQANGVEPCREIKWYRPLPVRWCSARALDRATLEGEPVHPSAPPIMQQSSSIPAFLPSLSDPELAAGAACGCHAAESVAGGFGATSVNASVRERNLKRLRRIEGQVRGLHRMIEDDRYCADILTQVSSAHEALRAVGRELMRNHIRFCTSAAVRAGVVDEMSDEIIEMLYRAAR
jgi:CsoR family transcriptional regulator, copper-sensing transcriptional repressor